MITESTTLHLDEADRTLLALIQESFPLSYWPYRELGLKTGLSEEQVLQRIRRLKEQGIIRHIGALLDSAAMGYHSTLVTFSIPPAQLDRAGEIVSRHPGVSHNYARDNERYNLWFTLTLSAKESLEKTIAELQEQAGALAAMNLPMVRKFKLQVYFDPSLKGNVPTRAEKSLPSAPRVRLLAREADVVRQLQQDLSLQDLNPFGSLERRLDMEEGSLLAIVRYLHDRGVMRRFSAQLNHRDLGFQANALGCWVAPPARIEEAGRALSSFTAVSHCYQRPVYSGWPYNLYTMIHGTARKECEDIAASMAAAAGLKDYRLLYSVKEYKKSRVSYAL